MASPAPVPFTSDHPTVRGIKWGHFATALCPLVTIAVVLYSFKTVAPLRLALLIALPALATLPVGVVAVRSALGSRVGALGWLFAPAWGFVLSSLVALALWIGGARGGWILIGAPLIALVPAWAFRVFRAGIADTTIAAPVLDRRDLIALSVALLLVPAVCGPPFAHVGERTRDGEHWRSYFTADMVWSMAVTAEVAKGDTPPKNMFRNGQALHYYWLSHLLSAIEHRSLKSAAELRQIVLVNALLSALAFVAFLYALVRMFLPSASVACFATVAAVLFHSFEGTQQLLVLWVNSQPLDLVRYMNIDGVTRWAFQGMPIDGLQRLLLYQPQHQLGYALGWSALIVLIMARDALRPRVTALVGVLLGMSFLTSTFSALMLTVASAAYLGIAVIRRKAWRVALPCALAAATPLVLAVVLSEQLQYVEHGGPLVTVGVNRVAFASWPTTIVLSFGASLIGAVAGTWFVLRAGNGDDERETRRRFAILWITIGTCWLFYFFVDVRDHQDVYVGWRAGHLLFIAFAPLTGYAWQRIERLGSWRTRLVSLGLAICVLLAALPTTLIDIYNTQDTRNLQQGPAHRWTLQLTPGELDALTWIRTSTPPNAIVQVEPFVRDRDTWAYIPAFAERRMAAGLPISMIPLAPYEHASQRIREIYGATDAAQANNVAQHLLIDYLVIGPPERAQYPQLESRLNAEPTLFRRVFHNDTVSVYAINRR